MCKEHNKMTTIANIINKIENLVTILIRVQAILKNLNYKLHLFLIRIHFMDD